jgi:hypothetical protein
MKDESEGVGSKASMSSSLYQIKSHSFLSIDSLSFIPSYSTQQQQFYLNIFTSIITIFIDHLSSFASLNKYCINQMPELSAFR